MVGYVSKQKTPEWLPPGSRLIGMGEFNPKRDLGLPLVIACGDCGKAIVRVIAERRADGTYRLAEHGDFSRWEVPPELVDRSVFRSRGPRTGGAGFWIEGDDLMAAHYLAPAVIESLRESGHDVEGWGMSEVISVLRQVNRMPRRRSIPDVLPGPGGASWRAQDPRPIYVFTCGCGKEYERKPNRMAKLLHQTTGDQWILRPDGRDGPGPFTPVAARPARSHL